MSDSLASLEEMRRQIDQIDDALHDLLMERVDIVAAIAAFKKHDGLPAMRPGREAQILRRLVGRHRGPLPRSILVRLWREILSGTTGLQVDFSVAAFVPDAAPGFWDLARDHFGSSTPMTAHRSASHVVHAVTEGHAMVGVLPMPQEGEADPWWPHLVSADAHTPRIFARLPFAGRGNARGGTQDALAIGRGEAEPTGADRTLLVIETRSEMSRARLTSVLSRVELEVCSFIALERPGASVNLLELEGMVTPGDPRLASALQQWGESMDRVSSLGGYAQPLSTAELGMPVKSAARPRREAR